MKDFIIKYASYFGEHSALELIHHKVECAEKYFEDGKRIDGEKVLKEAKEMIQDFLDCIE